MQELMPGVSLRRTSHGIAILDLHYSADPEKGDGPKTFVPEINRDLSPWALEQYKGMTDKTLFIQEFECDAEATQGSLLYQMTESATVIEDLDKPFLIPENWTRYFALDPHPGIPHACLWCAVDPWGDVWFYREYWPSKVCFRYENGLLLGKPGLCPPDDYRVGIQEMVNCIKYLESKEHYQNITKDGLQFDEKIHERVIDYTARAFGIGTNDDPEQENFQQRYEKFLSMPPKSSKTFFSDAKKDHDAGYERVRQGLEPRSVMNNNGAFESRSKFHILRSQCPELIWQIKNNRIQQLTPTQAQAQDPTGKPVKVRNHMADCLVSGTMVLTVDGEVSIEKVRIGQFVYTRQGLKRIADAWLVGWRPVITVELSNGKIITGTNNHRVFANGQWNSIDSLRYGDTLEPCEANQWFSMASHSVDIQNQSGEMTEFTSNQPPDSWESSIFIGPYGLRLTALYRKIMTFITKMKTRFAMNSVISGARKNLDIFPIIIAESARMPSVLHLKKSDLSLPHGINPRKGGKLKAKYSLHIGNLVNLLKEFVVSVMESIPLATCPIQMDFAQTTANQPSAVPAGLTMKQGGAQFASEDSRSTNTTRPKHAATNALHVVGSYRAGIEKVYDLAVEDAHEFYANGVLVHNCGRYLAMANPVYYEPRTVVSNHVEYAEGLSY